jgi:hypothetical protein
MHPAAQRSHKSSRRGKADGEQDNRSDRMTRLQQILSRQSQRKRSGDPNPQAPKEKT